jgi:hypothetical protein
MTDKRRCIGCKDDFYNDKNEYGISECWHLKSMEFGKFKLIPITLNPPYNHIKLQKLPKCYRKERYAKVSPEALTEEGYWK